MNNIPHPAPSVNPSVEAKSPPTPSKPYFAGLRWADSKKTGLTVLPGTVAKAPLVGFKQHIGSKCRPPNEEESASYEVRGRAGYQSRETGDVCDVQPLLVLDSCIPGYSLCVIDVDHPGALKDVCKFLLDLGITKTLSVQTGREGGGVHYYFRREIGKEALYHSANDNTLFGSHTNSEGKTRNSVDLKAAASYVVCPGAVHKTGRTYRAALGREEVTESQLGLLIEQIPFMPLDAWAKMRSGPSGRDNKRCEDENGLDQEWSAGVVRGEDPNWDKVLDAIRSKKRIVCPWCLDNQKDSAVEGKANLWFPPDRKSAICYRENKRRYLPGVNRNVIQFPISGEPNTSPNAPASIEDSVVNSRPTFSSLGGSSHELNVEDLFSQAVLGYADRVSDIHLAEMKQEYEAKGRQENADPFAHILVGLLESEEDIKGLEASTAILHDDRDRKWNHKCPNGMTVNAAWNHIHHGPQGSKRGMSCWSYRCSYCFPYLTAALASALEAYMTRAVSMGWKVQLVVADWEGHNTRARKVAMDRWCSAAIGDPDTREWLAIRTGVNEVHYMLMARNTDCVLPTALAKAAGGRNSGTPIRIEDVREKIEVVMARLKAGVDGITASRCTMNLVLGTLRACSTIKGLQDAITGKGRKGTGRAYGVRLLEQSQPVEETEGLSPKQPDTTDFISVPTRSSTAYFAAIKKHTGDEVSEKDPTAGGKYPKNTTSKLHMLGVDLPGILKEESQPGGIMPPVRGGKRRGNKEHQEKVLEAQEAINSGLDGGHNFKVFTPKV